ncbi:hypothetical protein AAII07_51305 [Microvirga sp. 0TCS3.31]
MISPHFKATLEDHRLEASTMNSSGSSWSYESVQALLTLAREGIPVSVISLKLKRSITEVRAKLDDLGVTPTADV